MTNSHGGSRSGAGNFSRYGEPTKVIRVPESLVPALKNLLKNWQSDLDENENESIHIYNKADLQMLIWQVGDKLNKIDEI